jgi:hypothetical protein
VRAAAETATATRVAAHADIGVRTETKNQVTLFPAHFMASGAGSRRAAARGFRPPKASPRGGGDGARSVARNHLEEANMTGQTEAHRLPEQHCSSCGNKLNAATFVGPDDPPPRPGDASLCLYCGHLSVYGDDLILRPLTSAEMYAVAGNPLLLSAQRLRVEYLKQHPRKGEDR